MDVKHIINFEYPKQGSVVALDVQLSVFEAKLLNKCKGLSIIIYIFAYE